MGAYQFSVLLDLLCTISAFRRVPIQRGKERVKSRMCTDSASGLWGKGFTIAHCVPIQRVKSERVSRSHDL
jgi:hypothetical protein